MLALISLSSSPSVFKRPRSFSAALTMLPEGFGIFSRTSDQTLAKRKDGGCAISLCKDCCVTSPTLSTVFTASARQYQLSTMSESMFADMRADSSRIAVVRPPRPWNVIDDTVEQPERGEKP